MRKRIIYKIVNPNGRIYIGQTVNMTNRMSCYRTLACKDQQKIYNSLVKHGFENHKVSILFEGIINQNLINELEIEYIELYKSNNQFNLNISKGGFGNSGNILSQKTKDLIRNARIKEFSNGRLIHNKGIPMTDEQKLTCSNTMKERYKDKTKHGRYGKVLSQETKDKIRESLKKTRLLKDETRD